LLIFFLCTLAAGQTAADGFVTDMEDFAFYPFLF